MADAIFDNLLPNDGDDGGYTAIVSTMTQEQITRYVSLGTYYEAIMTLAKLEVEFNTVKLKIIGAKDDDLESLKTHVEHGLIVQDRIYEVKTRMQDLYLYMKEKNWL
jgi:hypothetical protein